MSNAVPTGTRPAAKSAAAARNESRCRWARGEKAAQLQSFSRNRQDQKSGPPAYHTGNRPPAQPKGIAYQPRKRPEPHRDRKQGGLFTSEVGERDHQHQAAEGHQRRAHDTGHTDDQDNGAYPGGQRPESRPPLPYRNGSF